MLSKLKNVTFKRKLWNKQKVGDIHDWVKNSLEIVEASQRRIDLDPSNEALQTQLKIDREIAAEVYSI